MVKISALTPDTSPTTDDQVPVYDVSGTRTTRVTLANLVTLFFNNQPAVAAGTFGWTSIVNTPNTITANGNRNYDLVFNTVDLTGTLSPGMKLRLTRTTNAPSRCTSLNGTTQYYNDTSITGMTFTNNFVVSAWVKLSSYPSVVGTIASRFNGTSGWSFDIQSNGQIRLVGFNGGAGNFLTSISSASLPLDRWVHVAAQLDMTVTSVGTTNNYIVIDGVEVSNTATRGGTSPTALIQAGNLEIGAQNSGAQFFSGKLAQVAIYSAKVTQANILARMDRTLTGSETSLVSAYSFNNLITDLNANANNLTAQGSAVATNADSPYANAVTAGTIEYAEINAVTFATNTTVNVRVPDTCQIPTTGGVSAVSYSTQSNPYGLPYFSKVLAEVLLFASQTTTSSTAVIMTGATATVYLPANSKVKVSFSCSRVYNTTLNAQALLGIFDGVIGSGGVSRSNALVGATGLGAGYPITPVFLHRSLDNTTAGLRTFQIAKYMAVSGTSFYDADVGTNPMIMLVELV